MGCNTRGQTSEDEIEQIRSHREAVFRAHIYLNVLAIFREITSIDPEVKFLALCVFFFFHTRSTSSSIPVSWHVHAEYEKHTSQSNSINSIIKGMYYLHVPCTRSSAAARLPTGLSKPCTVTVGFGGCQGLNLHLIIIYMRMTSF